MNTIAYSGRFSGSHLACCLQMALATLCTAVCGLAMAAVVGIPMSAALVMTALTIGVGVVKGIFHVRMVPDVASQIGKVATAVIIAQLIELGSRFVLATERPDLSDWALVSAALFTGFVVGIHIGTMVLKRLWVAGHLRSSAIVLGNTALAHELALELRVRRNYGVDVTSIVDCDRFPPTGDELQRAVARLVTGSQVDRLIICPFTDGSRAVVRTARWAAAGGMTVYVVPRLHTMGVGMDSLSPDRIRGYPLVRVQRSSHPRAARFLKRVIDVGVSGAALVALTPVMALAAVAVKVTSPGPVLFTQTRVGRHGRPIEVHKFRSMTDDGRPDTEWTSESRITPVGAFLRRTAIDELPQLFGVFRGTMSLVGPRPERPAFVEEFRRQFDDYDDRHRMPVGLTGLSQIMGLVGDTPISERVKYDNLYIDQWSLTGDLQIMAKTVWSVIYQSRNKKAQNELARALDRGLPDLERSADGDHQIIELIESEPTGPRAA